MKLKSDLIMLYNVFPQSLPLRPEEKGLFEQRFEV